MYLRTILNSGGRLRVDNLKDKISNPAKEKSKLRNHMEDGVFYKIQILFKTPD